MQGHHLKYDDVENLVFFFPGYTNEIPLPNLKLSLYKSPSLTFTLVEEETCRSSISRRTIGSTAKDKADSSHEPPPTLTPLVPQAQHAEWFPAMQTPGFTLGYQPGQGNTPQPHEDGGSRWHKADDTAWAHHSFDSEGLPSPIHPRQFTSDHRELDDINTRLGGLKIRIGEIQNTLNTHVQDTRQWHLHQQQQFIDINALLRQQQEAQAAYWRSIGYNPEPQTQSQLGGGPPQRYPCIF